MHLKNAIGEGGLLTVVFRCRISRRQAAQNGSPSGAASSSSEGSQPASTAQHLVPLVFLDTLYHFPETLELANRSAAHYGATMHVFKPKGIETVEEFEAVYGKRLWERDHERLVRVDAIRTRT